MPEAALPDTRMAFDVSDEYSPMAFDHVVLPGVPRAGELVQLSDKRWAMVSLIMWRYREPPLIVVVPKDA